MERHELITKPRPCVVGELIIVQVAGVNRDPFVKYKGFVLFIKEVPPELSTKGVLLRVKVSRVGESYGFAEYVGG